MGYKKVFGILLLSVVIIITGCSKQTEGNDDQTIKVGLRSSELRTWEYIKKRAKEEGIDLELVTLSSSYDPNEALADGEVHINAFQHVAYLDTFKEKTDHKIVPIATTIIAPLGIYSNKYKTIDEIPDGAQIAIPNDASNWGRALILLQEAGLLTVVENFDGLGGADKVKNNPKKLKFIPVDGFNTPRAMDDTGISVIGNGVAVESGLMLSDALFHESATAKPYINVIAARDEDKDDAVLQEIVKIYQSDETAEFIQKTYDGNFLPTFISLEELATYKETYSTK